jgi:hypothetical protein
MVGRRVFAVVALCLLLFNTGCCCWRSCRAYRCGRINSCHECDACCNYHGTISEPMPAPLPPH